MSVTAITSKITARFSLSEIAGPERAPFNEIVTRYLNAVAARLETVRAPEPHTSAARSKGGAAIYHVIF